MTAALKGASSNQATRRAARKADKPVSQEVLHCLPYSQQHTIERKLPCSHVKTKLPMVMIA